MSLEQIVRPFQLPTNATTVRVQATGQREVRRVVLEFGKNGTGKVMTGSSSLNVSVYCDKYVVEKSA